MDPGADRAQLVLVVEAVAEALGVPLPVGAVERAARGVSIDPHGLVAVGRAVGVRFVALTGTADQMVACASPNAPIVVWYGPGFAILEGGRRATVRAVDAAVADQALDGVVGWFAAESSLPFSYGEQGPHRSPGSRLWSLARIERADLGALGLHAVAVAAVALATPVAIQTLVNQVAFGALLQPVIVLSALLFGALAFVGLVELSRQWTVEILQRRVFVRLVGELAYRLPRMSLEARDHTWTPGLVNRFFDVLTVQKSLSILLVDGMSVVTSIGIGTILLSAYHPWLFAYAVILVVSLTGAVVCLGVGGQRTVIAESYAKYEVAEWIEELARQGPALRAAGGPAFAMKRADQLAKAYLGARQDHFQILWRQIAALLFLQATANTLLLGVGGWLVISLELTLGQLVAAELVVGLIVGGFAKGGKLIETAYDLLAALDKLGHLIELPLERVGGEPMGPGGPAAVRVVGLGYGRGGKPLFSGLEFEVAAGERVAVVGPPGSGKRTLLELIAGARTPEVGRVEVDGLDLRTADLDTTRAQVALVLGSGVFDGTVAENIHLGREDVGHPQVRAALAAVGLLEAGMRLPQGLETRLLPDGQPMSEGQATRLGLARAVAARPRLLLVDERGLASDAAAKARVRALLMDPSRPWTLILVTSDSDLARECDRRVTLGGA